MEFKFGYEKKKVIQALRYHFISRGEIKILMVLVNVFAIVSAVLFYMKKIRPEPFLLGSVIWLLLMVTVWYLLPYTIYKKNRTFQDVFRISFDESGVELHNAKGSGGWPWEKFSHWLESPHFFHFYFDTRSFFLFPKDDVSDAELHELRGLLKKNIHRK